MILEWGISETAVGILDHCCLGPPEVEWESAAESVVVDSQPLLRS